MMNGCSAVPPRFVSVCVLAFGVHLGAYVGAAQAEAPWARFETHDIAARLSLVNSNLNLEGEADYLDNYSGCCLEPDTGELLIVINRSQNFSKPPAIHVYGTDGTYHRHIDLNGFSDTEGVCVYDPAGSRFAILDESVNEITILTITPLTTSLNKADGVTIATGIVPGADGLEGVTYDRGRGVFYVVQEHPMGVFQVATNAGGAVATALFDAPAVLAGYCTDLSDIVHDPVSDRLFLLSDEGKLILECERDGTIVATHALNASQPEGITLGPGGAPVYVCGEPNEFFDFALTPPTRVVAEGRGAELTVRLSASVTNAVYVDWTATGLTAQAGMDYALPAHGTLSLEPGTCCATVTVSILKDTVVEGSEIVRVSLTNAVGANLAGDSAYDIEIVNAPATVPVLGTQPFDCIETPDATPEFEFTSTDPDGTAGLVYAIRWSSDPDFVAGVTMRNSESDDGFVNTEAPGDTCPFAGGQRVRFTMDTADALSDTPPDTAVYWQVRARDSAAEFGSDEWGAWSACRSLRVNTALPRPQWGQTSSTQFAGDTLEGVVVTPSNGVALGTRPIERGAAVSAKVDGGTALVIPNVTTEGRPNRLLVVGIVLRNGAAVSGVTYAGESLSLLAAADNGTTIRAQIWYLAAPPATTASVNIGFNAQARAMAGAAAWYGVDSEQPFGTAAKATGNGLSAAVTVGGEAGAVIVDAFGVALETTVSPGAAQSAVWDGTIEGGFAVAFGAGGGGSRAPADAATTMSWTWEDPRSMSRKWAIVAVPLRQVAADTGTVLSPAVDLNWLPPLMTWGTLTFGGDETGGDLSCDLQYWDGATWRDTALVDLRESPVDLGGLIPAVCARLRLAATLTAGSGTPTLADWGVSWEPTGTCSVYVVSEYGGLAPATNPLAVSAGTLLSLSVTNSPVLDGTNTRYLCDGWVQTGCEPRNGAGPETSAFAVTNHSRVAWQWRTQYWVSASAARGGSVAGGNQWADRGSRVVMQALPETYYFFSRWDGDVAPAASHDSSLTTIVDSAACVIAQFAEELATNDTPKVWLFEHYGSTNAFDALALADTDGDGMPAWGEYRAGTDPTNARSVLRVTQCVPGPDGVRIRWSSVTGRTYSVFRSTDPATLGSAGLLTGGIAGAVGGTNELRVIPEPGPRAFYRIGTSADGGM